MKLIVNHFLELIPREPPARIVGLVLIGQIREVEGATFFLHSCSGLANALLAFRVDENEEIAVQVGEGSIFEIGRSVPPHVWNSFVTERVKRPYRRPVLTPLPAKPSGWRD